MRFPLGLVLVAGLLAGCGAKNDEPPKSNALTAPVDYIGAVGKAKKTAERVVDVVEVRKAIELFHASEDRFPASLKELSDTKYFPNLPKPPVGTKYFYNPQTGAFNLVKE